LPAMPQRFVASNDKPTDDFKDNDDKVVEEVYTSKTREVIDAKIKCIDDQRAKGNEAFTTGEYAQAVQCYTILTLHNAARRPAVRITRRRQIQRIQ
jgi:hypothetical protein